MVIYKEQQSLVEYVPLKNLHITYHNRNADSDKVELFANDYFLSQNSTLSSIRYTNEVSRPLSKILYDHVATHLSNSSCFALKIRIHIRNLKSKTSNNSDVIHIIVIKNLFKNSVVYVTNVINAILLIGYYPLALKKSINVSISIQRMTRV